MEKFKIGQEAIRFYGKLKGSNSNKWNRVNKLAAMYNELRDKLHGMAERGMQSNTETYRCAVATLLLMETGIRIGNEGSAEGYHTVPHPYAKNQQSKFVKTYGLTTLLRKHVKEVYDPIARFYFWQFEFVGKKQVENTFRVPANLEKYVTKIVQHSTKDPLFGITDYQLTKFIKKYVGRAFTPKDFRTLRANIYAYQELDAILSDFTEPRETKKQCRGIVQSVCMLVSEKLNNTPGVCKRSYINELLFIENLNL